MHEVSIDWLIRINFYIKIMKEKQKKNELYNTLYDDEVGPRSRLFKGYRLLNDKEIVGEKDYFFIKGHWLSVTFREEHSPIKPGDVIDKSKRMFVMRKVKNNE